MTQIIESLLDIDLYKFTVGQVFFNRFSSVEAEYDFTCRNKDKVELLKYVPEAELREQIFEHLPKLALTDAEYDYLAGLGYFKEPYLQFLKNFRFQPDKQITIVRDEANKTYQITAKGPLAQVVLYETMILCIVNEIFERNYSEASGGLTNAIFRAESLLRDKMYKLAAYNRECGAKNMDVPKLIEFGTRRRFSASYQRAVLESLIQCMPNLAGTSNVHLARTYGIPVVGTFGHEFPMALQGIYRVQDSQKRALEIWLEEYQGKLAIALGDTLTDAKFARDFDYRLAKAYDGQRHDSGDPFEFGESRLTMYDGMGIDPATKKIVFSDGLDFDQMIALHRRFERYIQTSFGIGTYLTNDTGNPVPQIVMKIVKCNNQDVAKLSNNPAKASCRNPLYLEYLRMAAKEY